MLKEAQGNLNLETLTEAGILILTQSEITMVLTKCTVDNLKAIFIGQQLNNRPNGFVRLIYETGALYEGVILNGSKDGFGRFITSNSIKIGWWKDGNLSGKSICF